MLWILFQGPGPGPMRHPILRIGCRVALLLLIMICRAVYIFVEQPASSRLFLVPYYAFIQDMCGHFGIKFRNSFLSETELYVAAGSIFLHVLFSTAPQLTLYKPQLSLYPQQAELDGFIWALQPEAFTWVGHCVGPSTTFGWQVRRTWYIELFISYIEPECFFATSLHAWAFNYIWNSPYTFQPRPWIPRLFLRMTAGLRNKLSSEGVTVKKVDPKTGKKTVSDTQLT